jgi:phenylacetate-CoA ligase
MPRIRRRVFYPLFGMLNKSPKLRYWKHLEKTQYLPDAQLREIQWQRLKDLLFFSWKNNEFYQKRFEQAGVTPDDICHPDDLNKLPILTKADIRNNSERLISQGFDFAKLQRAKTGGSTGKALDLYFTEECSELRNACALRHDRWTGWEPGEPIAACWGNPVLPKNIKEKIKHQLLQPMIYLDTMRVSEASVQAFIEEWRQGSPSLLFGHAHSLYVLAQYLRDFGVTDLRPKGILSTSMMLIPSERKLIEKVFDRKVIDRYGCEEVGLISCECEKHEGMHLNIEHLFIEFLQEDDTPAPIGKPGRIVVTDLVNQAMPLIRYQVEDMGMLSDRKCSCGRGLPLMEHVSGRVADFLLRKDGSQVAGISLIENTLTYFPGIDQMQIIQNAIDQFNIVLVRGKDFNDATSSALEQYFRSQFGDDILLDIQFVDGLNPDKNGKFRFSICKIA